MTKQEILEYFGDINHAYNDCGKLDSLSYMIDELFEDIKAEIKTRYDEIPYRNNQYDDAWIDALEWVMEDVIDKHIGKEQE